MSRVLGKWRVSQRYFSAEGGKSILKPEITSVLDAFHAPIRFACAYGSGAFVQDGYGSSQPMVDFIFGVLNNLTRSHMPSIGIA